MSNAILNQPKAPNEGRYHWTVDAFYRAVSADVFDEPNRLELINGDLWEKEPVKPPHADLTEEIAQLLRTLLEPGLRVREEKPFHVAFDGEPIPDIYVATAEARRGRGTHPNADEVRLIIEVADSSVGRDTGEKALLYAQAAIADYWVSIIGSRQLLIFRNPTPGGYAASISLTENDVIQPLAVPEVTIAVRDLLARVTVPEAE